MLMFVTTLTGWIHTKSAVSAKTQVFPFILMRVVCFGCGGDDHRGVLWRDAARHHATQRISWRSDQHDRKATMNIVCNILCVAPCFTCDHFVWSCTPFLKQTLMICLTSGLCTASFNQWDHHAWSVTTSASPFSKLIEGWLKSTARHARRP